MRDYTVIPLSELPLRIPKICGETTAKKSLYPCLVKIISFPTQYFDPASVARETSDIYALIEDTIPHVKVYARQKISKSHPPSSSNLHNYHYRSSSRYGSARNLQQTSKAITLSVERCKGWFEILSEDEKAAPGITTVQDLVTKFPDSCLVRKNIWAYSSSPPPNRSPGWRIIQGGELLGLIAQEIIPYLTKALIQAKAPGLPFGAATVAAACSSGNPSSGTALPPSSNERFLRCIDYGGFTWYLPLGSKGYFSPVAKRENISGVHTLKDITQKFHLPLKVKLVHYHCSRRVVRSCNERVSDSPDEPSSENPMPEGSVLRLLSAGKEIDFDVYVLSTEGIKKLRLPHACARKMFVQYPTKLSWLTVDNLDTVASDVNPTIKACLALLKKMQSTAARRAGEYQYGAPHNQIDKILPLNRDPVTDTNYQRSPYRDGKFVPIYSGLGIKGRSGKGIVCSTPTGTITFHQQQNLYGLTKREPTYDYCYANPSKAPAVIRALSFPLDDAKSGDGKIKTVSRVSPTIYSHRWSSPDVVYQPTPCPDTFEGRDDKNDKGYSLRTVRSDETHLNANSASLVRKCPQRQKSSHVENEMPTRANQTKSCFGGRKESLDLATKLHSLISDFVVTESIIKGSLTTENSSRIRRFPEYMQSETGTDNKLNKELKEPSAMIKGGVDDCAESHTNSGQCGVYQFLDLDKSPGRTQQKRPSTIVHKLKLWISSYVKDFDCDYKATYYNNLGDKADSFQYQSCQIQNSQN